MIRTSFNDGWQTRAKVNPFAELSGTRVPFRPVTLPHDAMVERERAAPGGEVTMEGGAGAYFPGGTYEYRKTFSVPEEQRGKRILFEFEGVYRDAIVFINGDYAGQRPFGYSHFFIDADRFLRFGQDNEIRVEARAHRDSRWYTGAGIYRDTWMLVGEVVRIPPDGVRVTTPDIDDERAVVEVATRVENDSIAIRTVDVRHGDPRCRREHRRERRLEGHGPAGRARCCTPTPLRTRPVAVEPGLPRPVRRRCGPAGRGRRRGCRGCHLRYPFPAARPRAGAADQRRDGQAARCLYPPRQRGAGRGDLRPRRGTPGPAPQGGRVQRDPHVPQPA